MQELKSQELWPGWETVRLIGRGSYGAVYEIRRTVFGHTEKAALKVISIPRDAGDIDELISEGYDSPSISRRYEDYLKKIIDEYAHMAEMKGHPNIVYCDDLYYVRHSDGIGWDVRIKMELLTPLNEKLKNGIDEEMVRKLASDISNALAFCESRGLLHRDIKPQNIFISSDGTYKLGDFGVAKLSEQTVMLGTKAGTFRYMAPEVYFNQPYGSKADVYSLGLTLYYLLNERRLPFLPLPPALVTADQEENAREERLRGTPIPPPAHGSEELKRIVMQACAYDMRDRCSASEMQKMLNRTPLPPETVQVRFLNTDQSVISCKSYRVGDPIELPVIPDYESDGFRYRVKGWSPDPSPRVQSDADYMIVWERKKARASWVPAVCTVAALAVIAAILFFSGAIRVTPREKTADPGSASPVATASSADASEQNDTVTKSTGLPDTAEQTESGNPAPSEETAGLIVTAELPDAVYEKEYRQVLSANTSSAETWAVAAGLLPDGLTLSGDGVISGTPSAAGSFSFTVTVSNAAVSESRSFTITVTGKEFSPAKTAAFNGHTYELYDVSLTWENAQKYCKDKGGHLAVITSAEEQSFINSLLPGEKNLYWIGLKNTDSWTWANGEALSYANWAVGEPTGGAETFCQLYGADHKDYALGEWNDIPNEGDPAASYYRLEKTGFICEYEESESSYSAGQTLSPDTMLYTLVPSETSNKTPGFVFYDSGHDNEDNWYSNSIGGYEGNTTNWCEYRINGAYKTISGVVYLNYEHRNATGNHTKLTIYGDGKLLYTSGVITKDLVPQHFCIDIEDVQLLRVCIYGIDYVRLSDCVLSASASGGAVSSGAASLVSAPERQLSEFSPVLSNFRVIPAVSAAATSEVLYHGYLFQAGFAIDGDLTTCWQESVEGDGIGENLTIYFDQIQTIDALRLRLGYASYYESNGRPKTLEFAFSDGTAVRHVFSDQNRDFYLRLSSPVNTDYIRLTILDAYTGSQWSDTCITEVTAYQLSANGNAAASAGNSQFCGYCSPESLVGLFGVQVGAFKPYDSAENYAKQIVDSENKLGNTQNVLITIRGDKYVTCLGPFETREEANYQSNLLNTEGYQSYAIKFELN